MQKIWFLVFLLSIIFISSKVYAIGDYELRESRKCSNIFSYFEKKHNLPVNSLYSISLHETAKKHSRHNILVVWPWTVMNNKEKKGYHFKTQNEAIGYAKMQFVSGNKNLDVGCMQINLKYHPDAFVSLDQAFSPKSNIAYGAYFLNKNREKLGSIEKAIGRYHSATEHLAVKYCRNISRINQAMREYNNNLRKACYSSRVPIIYKKPKGPYNKGTKMNSISKRSNRAML